MSACAAALFTADNRVLITELRLNAVIMVMESTTISLSREFCNEWKEGRNDLANNDPCVCVCEKEGMTCPMVRRINEKEEFVNTHTHTHTQRRVYMRSHSHRV